ncbi:hypothetical protein L6R52_02450 [Myxococcota bacterium]|nr:hypothetical protein [Myxococcota bacterium]
MLSVDPGWTVSPGFRAVTIADATDGLSQPVALVFAGGAFADRLYVVDQGTDALVSIDPDTGVTTTVVAANAWPVAPALLTTIAWDRAAVFDGQLYVGDQGSDGDADSRVFRVSSAGAASAFLTAPGPGLDDVYGLDFVPSGRGYPAGLYVTGDTDGSGVDWGAFDVTGAGAAFSEVAGVEGIAFDTSGLFGGGLFAARPLGGGYAGDGTITPILATGLAGAPLATNLGGVHAIVFAPGGTWGRDLYAASWSTGQLLAITPAGAVTTVASGLSLTNYDGNILDFSPDGNVLYVADRQASRVVCIEPL